MNSTKFVRASLLAGAGMAALLTGVSVKDFVQHRGVSGTYSEVLRCGMEMFWASGQKRPTPNYIRNKYGHPIHFLTTEMCGVGCLSIPKEALDLHRFDVRWPHWQDTHLFVRLMMNYRLEQINAYNYLYRQHDQMGTHQIFKEENYQEERLQLTLEAMRDLKDNCTGLDEYIDDSEWNKIFAKKYMNYALETSNAGKKIAWKYLRRSWSHGFFWNQLAYYLRIPFFILRFKLMLH